MSGIHVPLIFNAKTSSISGSDSPARIVVHRRLAAGEHRRVLPFRPRNMRDCTFPCMIVPNFWGSHGSDGPARVVADSQEGLKNYTIAEDAKRNVSLDGYRGFVMLLMMAEVLRLGRVAAAYPSSSFLKFLAFNQTHVAPLFRFPLPAAWPGDRAFWSYSHTRCGVHWHWRRWAYSCVRWTSQ